MHEIVLVSASKLSGFCRAKVIGPSLDDNTKFKCSFIDLGRLETIPLDCFYELPSYYSVSKVSKNIFIYLSHLFYFDTMLNILFSCS